MHGGTCWIIDRITIKKARTRLQGTRIAWRVDSQRSDAQMRVDVGWMVVEGLDERSSLPKGHADAGAFAS